MKVVNKIFETNMTFDELLEKYKPQYLKEKFFRQPLFYTSQKPSLTHSVTLRKKKQNRKLMPKTLVVTSLVLRQRKKIQKMLRRRRGKYFNSPSFFGLKKILKKKAPSEFSLGAPFFSLT